MATATPSEAGLREIHSILEMYAEQRWYAAYTCANHERRVQGQLEQKSVESFLPLYRSVRRWKDRRVLLDLPLFPGYIFVRLALRDRLRVLQIPSIVRLVGFSGIPVPLPDQDIESLRGALRQQLRVEPHPYLTIGKRVRILRGPLEGKEGILLRRKANLRVILSIDLIVRSIVVDVDAADVESILAGPVGTGSRAATPSLQVFRREHRRGLA
jgi:transcription antitermination factor NusG